MKVFAFMPFWHWSEVMNERPKDYDYILGNVIITENFSRALFLYSETKCPASQIVEAGSYDELYAKMEEMENDFKNPEWVKELEEYL